MYNVGQGNSVAVQDSRYAKYVHQAREQIVWTKLGPPTAQPAQRESLVIHHPLLAQCVQLGVTKVSTMAQVAPYVAMDRLLILSMRRVRVIAQHARQGELARIPASPAATVRWGSFKTRQGALAVCGARHDILPTQLDTLSAKSACLDLSPID